MVIAAAPIDGVFTAQRMRKLDDRGFLERLFERGMFAPHCGRMQVSQVNHTQTAKRGTVRGIHLQLEPNQETKVIQCIQGSVFDVAVDLRPHSPTFLKWFGCELSPSNLQAMIIPEGVGHAVQALEDDSHLIYFHTAPYVPESEAVLHPLSAQVGIAWPLHPVNLSQRDAEANHRPDFLNGDMS